LKKYCFNIFFTLLILSLFSCIPKKTNSDLVSEAKVFIQKEEISTAVIILKNVLQSESKNAEARFLLGNIYFQQDDFVNAEESIEKAIKNNYSSLDAMLILAKVKLELNKFDEVLSLLNKKTFINDFDQTFAFLLQGQAKLATNNAREASSFIRKANKLSSISIHSMYGTSLLFAYNQKLDLALKSINDVIDKEKNHAEGWLLKGSIHANRKENKKAAEAYLKYFELTPKNVAIKISIAHNFILAGEYDRARTHVEALREINDNNARVNVLSAQIAYIDKNYQLAKELADSVALSSNSPLAQMISGLSRYNLKDFENAYYQLNAISDVFPKDHQVNKTLALLQLKLGYRDEFAVSLNNLGDSTTLSNEDAGLYASLGMEAFQQGDTENAKEMFERAVILSPNNANLQTQLGILKLANSNDGKVTDSGVKELKKAIAINPNQSRANIALAMTYLRLNNFPEAIDVANNWREIDPSSSLAHILSANIALKMSKTADAIKYFKEAIGLDKNNITPLFSLAIIATNQENYKQSNQYLEQLVSIDAEYPRAYQLLVANALRTGQEENLKQKLMQLIAETPDVIWPRILLSRRQLDNNQLSEAIKTLTSINNYTNYPNRYFTQLIEAYTKSKNTTKAQAAFTLWQEHQEDNAIAYLSQINLLEKQRNYREALTVTQQALKQEKLKSHLQLLTLESYYLLATTQTETASRKIRSLALNYPNDAFVLRLQGQLAIVHKKFPDAIPFLTKSYDLKANTYTGLYLATSYKNNNERQKAIDFLQEELTQTPKNKAYRKYLAQLNITTTPENAIKQYTLIVKDDPRDVTALNNLAWMLLQQGRQTEALHYGKQAAEIAPNNPQVLDTLGLILLKKELIPEAMKVLTMANKALPNDVEILIHLARAMKASNQNENADKLINSLSKEDKNKWSKELNAIL